MFPRPVAAGVWCYGIANPTGGVLLDSVGQRGCFHAVSLKFKSRPAARQETQGTVGAGLHKKKIPSAGVIQAALVGQAVPVENMDRQRFGSGPFFKQQG